MSNRTLIQSLLESLGASDDQPFVGGWPLRVSPVSSC